ncbi:cytochrome c oxidase assembly protein COX16 homolog, mitochondrial [Drosophila miranda]|uniref:Cytochrome c oxidase assembly protein COX16 homolog, mitochondrial n=2 Tax=pseudoobscura subgroup TaxID=32358 RepID=A0A6I8URU2_DROPS|nr:cytochrome c oxidase assembly protein COX16 homolog, mitochondrial [Drosophila pseudoobscura]XP_002019708.2 cytochrome c oxidase assembly protein COX16 homolog, mitochondrial [Drosophila persimilis]XP_017140706.1 cytochrome c oxidase assembly protein COX16 homolog, mitochondrial [Drosophila miranda]
MSFSDKLKYYSKRKSFKYGVPFLIMMVAGSFGLQQFSNLRYQYSKKQPVTPDEMKKYGVNMKKRQEVTLETEYDKVRAVNIDEWENKRGPRPWEEEGLSSPAKH